MRCSKLKIRGFLALGMCVLLIMALLIGCGQKGNTAKTEQQPAQSSENGAKDEQNAQKQTSQGPEPLTLPIVKEPITLTWFTEFSDRSAASIKNNNEMLSYQELEKRTGIHIDFKHPPIGQTTEQFNLMVASQNYEDMISYGWLNYNGGPEKAISDGVIIQLNDLIKKYAPNLTKILNDDPAIRKDVMTDSGKLYMFPFLRLGKAQWFYHGFEIRKDWLDKLGLKVPTNINEWYTVLKAFKENDLNGNGKADEIPFVSTKLSGTATAGVSAFVTGWGILYDFYQDNGKVKFGPIEPAFKDYIQTMRQWYKEGLIDPDFIGTDTKGFDAKIVGNLAGSFCGNLNGNMGKYTSLMQGKDPNFLLEAVPYPAAPDGKVYTIDAVRAASGRGNAISTKNKYPVESTKWNDYFYSNDGILLMNYGIEGVTYNMVNGKPIYTDLILHNPDGLSLDQAIAKYTPAGTDARLVQDMGYWEQILQYPNQKRGMDVYQQVLTDKTLPALTPSIEESTRLAQIMTEINTYRDEMCAKFIMGQEPMENFDKFVQTIKSMGIDEAISIQQAALERYNKRGE